MLNWRMACGLAFALAAGSSLQSRPLPAQFRPAAPEQGEWLTYGRSYDQQRFVPLTQINRATVAKLGLAWWAEFDTDRGQEATPLIHDGVLYTTTAWSKVYAFDARTGRKLWSYDPEVPGEKGFDACCDVVNRGVALWNGKVYVGTIDGRLVALDAKTGKRIWQVATVDASKPYTITGAPLAAKGKIFIGNGGSDKATRGYLSAYDAETGKLSWRFFMAPHPQGAPDGAASDSVFKGFAGKTWSPGAWQLGGGGGSPWDPITFDPVNNLIFTGTGNAAPWNDRFRDPTLGNDNLFTASIVALNPDTGAYVWHYQTTPRDAWDYDATQQLTIANLPIGGRIRRVVMQANKNGFYYVLNAADGKLLSAENYVPVDWADRIDLKTGRPLETAIARYADGRPSTQMPSAVGGHTWQPMAYSPRQNLVYIPAHVGRGNFGDSDDLDFVEGLINTGMGRRSTATTKTAAPTAAPPPVEPSGELVAWDPVAQKARWRVGFRQFWHSGVLATAGDLVFHSAGQRFNAYDAATGKVLWHYNTVASAIAPAVSYVIGGQQYVALMVGYGGAMAFGSDQIRRPGRLLVFKLGATAKAPRYIDTPRPGKLDLSAAVPSNGDPAVGKARFDRMCAVCHRSGDFLPYLPRSGAILEPDTFKAIVHDGALKANGMASFSRFLTVAEVENIRAYLLTQAAATNVPANNAGHAQ